MIKGIKQKNDSRRGQKAQSFTEYTMLIGVIVMVLFSMNSLIKRATQGMIKVAADQIGNQKEGDQMFDDSGHLISSYISTRAAVEKTTTEVPWGAKKYSYNDAVYIDSSALINLGFSEGTD